MNEKNTEDLLYEKIIDFTAEQVAVASDTELQEEILSEGYEKNESLNLKNLLIGEVRVFRLHLLEKPRSDFEELVLHLHSDPHRTF